MSSGPPLDLVTLNGINYAVQGKVTGESLSEFEDGFKIGRATYDSREHAFFMVMDNFANGFGRRRVDTYEDAGTYWDSLRSNSPDLSHKSRVTLGPAKATPTIDSAPTKVTMSKRNPSQPSWFMPDGSYCVGFGNKIYKTTNGTAFVQVGVAGADAAELQSFVESVENDGTITHFAFFASDSESLTGTARWMKSIDGGATWVNGVDNYVLHDGIYWDNKIIAAHGRTIIFGTVLAGVPTWNIDVALDGKPVGAVSHGHIHFLGVAEASFGQPSVWFTDESDLYVLDFPSRKVYKQDVGLAGHRITASCQWRGNFYMSDSWNVMEYDIGSRAVNNIGFPVIDGISDTLRTYAITALVPSEGSLMAIVSLPTVAPNTLVFQYRGTGWTQMGEWTSGVYSHSGFQGNFNDAYLGQTRYFYTMQAPSLTSTTFSMTSYKLAGAGHIPLVGTDSFAASGAQFTTGWIDGGFLDLQGTAFRLMIDGWNLSSSNSIVAEYQIDNLESSSWVQMVDASNVPNDFENGHQHSICYFSAANPLLGITFKTVRFRFTIKRGADATQSPEIRAFTFVYVKKPILRTGWKFTIDCSRMINEGWLINGVPATFATILSSLVTTWNTQTLTIFSVPNVRTGMAVLPNRYAVSVDNMRSANPKPGDGVIEVSVLEPVVQ